MEKTDVTGSGCIETIFQRNIIDKRFNIICSLCTGRYLAAKHYLETIVEETL